MVVVDRGGKAVLLVVVGVVVVVVVVLVLLHLMVGVAAVGIKGEEKMARGGGVRGGRGKWIWRIRWIERKGSL